MRKTYTEVCKMLRDKGFEELCPSREWDFYSKYPFIVRVAPLKGCDSYRQDRQYQYGYRLGTYRTIK